MKYKEIVLKSNSVYEKEINEYSIEEVLLDVIKSLIFSNERFIEVKKANQEGYNSRVFLGENKEQVYKETIEDTFEYYLSEAIVKICSLYDYMDLTRSTIDQRVKNFLKRNSIITKNKKNTSEDILILCSQVCSINMSYNWSNLGTDLEDNFANIISKIENIAEESNTDLNYFVKELINIKIN